MSKNRLELEERFFALFDPFIDLERNTGRKYTDSEYSLDGIRELADLTGHPENKQRIIHIAGTKGKGSTAAFLAALLQSAGYSSGAFASPHLSTVRERFLLNGKPVGYDLLLGEAQKLLRLVTEHGLNPTFFELMTILALMICQKVACQWTILETGIGGRLDCTNFIADPACVIITPISRDHTALLGESIREIAREKAGIIKPETPVICAPQPYPEAVDVLRRTADNASCRFIHVEAKPQNLRPWGLRDVPLFMQENFRTALTACKTLHITPSARNFQPVWPRGRCEKICDSPLVVIDAAHNADSARRLREAITAQWPDMRFTVILGVVKGKDTQGIVKELGDILRGRLVLTNPRPPKASGLDELTLAVTAAGFEYQVCPDIHSRADLPPANAYLFVGSFFTATIGDELFGSGSDSADNSV